MEVTFVEVTVPIGGPENLLAFCTVEFDHCFFVHGVRVIRGPAGIFLAMPSKKAIELCRECNAGNPFDAKFCMHCGRELEKSAFDEAPRAKRYWDMAHPKTTECRERVTAAVLAAYERAVADRAERAIAAE